MYYKNNAYNIISMIDNEENDENFKTDRCIETPTIKIKENFLYVQESGFLECHKPYCSRRNELNSYLIIFVLSGSGFFTYDGITTEASSGACFFIDCSKPYSHECKSGSTWELLWVHFNGTPAQLYYEHFLHFSTNVLYPADGMVIANTLKAILDNTKNRARHYELKNNAFLTTLITELITMPKVGYKPPVKKISIDDKLDEIHMYVSQNYMNDCSLETLSEKFYVSKYYLSREFANKFGENLSSYLTGLRITRAKQLLRFSTKKVNEIASLCGINDSNHFLKTFKKIEGLTPSQYRKQWNDKY